MHLFFFSFVLCFYLSFGSNCRLQFQRAKICKIYKFDERCIQGDFQYCELISTKRNQNKCPVYVCNFQKSDVFKDSKRTDVIEDKSNNLYYLNDTLNSGVFLENKTFSIQNSSIEPKRSENKTVEIKDFFQNRTKTSKDYLNDTLNSVFFLENKTFLNQDSSIESKRSENKTVKIKDFFINRTKKSKDYLNDTLNSGFFLENKTFLNQNSSIEPKRSENKGVVLKNVTKNKVILNFKVLPIDNFENKNISNVTSSKKKLFTDPSKRELLFDISTKETTETSLLNKNVHLKFENNQTTSHPSLSQKLNILQKNNHNISKTVSVSQTTKNSKNNSFNVSNNLIKQNISNVPLVSEDLKDWKQIEYIKNFSKNHSSEKSRLKNNFHQSLDKKSRLTEIFFQQTFPRLFSRMPVDCGSRTCSLEFHQRKDVSVIYF